MTTEPSQPDAERLARGALLQQGAQVVRMAGGLVVLTVLARRLSLGELGTYTILLSFITYVQFVKASVMNAAVVGIAEATDDVSTGRVVSTGFVVYAALGLVSGVALAAIGLAVVPILNVPAGLEGSARIGVIGLAAVTAIGWPVQIFDDLLRGQQRFAAVSILEIGGMLAYVAGAIALILVKAPVWALVTWSASIPLITGVACMLALGPLGAHVIFSRHLVDRAEARRFGSVTATLVVGGIADLAIYSFDRVILSAIRSPALVGRYEGPLQMQNSVRYLHGVLSAPVVPAAARYLAEGDAPRLRELFLRGLRYTLAITCPFVVVLGIQTGPILTAWLGSKFGPTAHAASLFVSWWLIGANTGVVGTFLYAARRFGFSARMSWLVAAINLAITLSLTASIGIYGPIIGVMTGFAVSLCISFPVAARIAGATLRDVAREAWLPAYSTAALLAGLLLLVRSLVDLTSAGAAIATLAAGPLVYWLLFAVLWARSDEIVLVRRTLLPHRRGRHSNA